MFAMDLILQAMKQALWCMSFKFAFEIAFFIRKITFFISFIILSVANFDQCVSQNVEDFTLF